MERAVEQEFGKPDSGQEPKRRSRSLMAGEHRGRQLTSAARQPWKIGEAAQQVGRDRTLCRS